MKLRKSDKKKWVAALRSGKYKQGQSQLHNVIDNTYCCLGVACDIGLANPQTDGTFVEYDFLHDDIQDKLAGFNDGTQEIGNKKKPKSFKWIAAYIERYL